MTSGDAKWTSDSTAYLLPRTGSDAWTAEAQDRRKTGSQQLMRVCTANPTPDVRQGLGLEECGEAVLRERLILLDDQPVEIASSWYPAALAAGTPLAEGKKIRGGAPTLLSSLGHQIRSATEDVESRGASPHEASLLRIGQGEPVLVLTRVARDQDGQPIEMSVMVTPGSERRLRYEMRVD